MTRRRADPAAIEAAKREFWEASALFALRRAAARARAGAPIDEGDRELVGRELERLADLERARIRDMKPTRLRAYIADYLQRELGITDKEALAAVAGEHTTNSIKQVLKTIRGQVTPLRVLARAARSSKTGTR
jgi:hypothetical protein